MKMRIHLIVAARPNFMKIAPLFHALSKQDWAEPYIIHIGQHYDENMSDVFFADLRLPSPHVHLEVGSGSHAEQTGRVMMAYEKMLERADPDLVVVADDVNSTLAVTLAAVKLGFRVAHLEAGLRSFDRSMPEEINRVVIDALADILWTHSVDGDENLLREGIAPEKIDRVGNILIDSLEMLRPQITDEGTWQQMGLTPGTYGIVTLHHPSNVDDADTLAAIISTLGTISSTLPMVFPLHPRTRSNLEQFDLLPMLSVYPGLRAIDPVGYISFMNLLFNCRLAVTDSGGVQEETSYLGIPCLTLQPNTARPITVTRGTNRLSRPGLLQNQIGVILSQSKPGVMAPELWDGHTALRVVTSMRKFLL